VKALFFGLGSIGQRHLRNLRVIAGPELQVSALRTRCRQIVLNDRQQVIEGESLEEKYSLTTFTELSEALAWKPDIALICNPNSLHIPSALAAAEAGCHLLIEKPLSHDLEGTEKLAAILDEKKKIGFVAYQMRFHPLIRLAKEIIRESGIGRILSARAERGEYMPGWHPYEDYRESYAARSDQGGGALLSQIHEMDYLYSLFGLPSRLFAVGGHLSSLEVDVDDVASVLMSCRVDGQEIPVELHLDYVQRPASQTLRIIGDEGKIDIDFPSMILEHHRLGELVRREEMQDFQRNQLFLDEMNHFLACTRGEEKPLVSIRDGAQSLRMALAAKESLRTGNTVTLNP
jgi:predicted dehydrogenase